MVLIQNYGRDKLLKYLTPTKLKDKKVIGNIYRPPYNLRYTLNTFMGEFNATLLENNAFVLLFTLWRMNKYQSI